MSIIPFRRFTFALLACSLLGACDGRATPVGPTQRLVMVGRVERGATSRVVARDGVDADSLVSDVTVTPAEAATVTGGSIRLLRAGPLTLSARASDGTMLTAQVDVAVPPTVFFDAVASGNRDVYSVALDGLDAKRWTSAPADDTHPTAAAGTLVFRSTRDGNGELYATPLAGGNEQRLTTTAADEAHPALLASGTRLAYTTDASGVPRVHVAPAALTSTARLTAASFGFAGSIEASPAWSPSGDRIALVATTNGRANLFIASATAGALPSAVAGSGALHTDVEPAWSPDGNLIAFTSTRVGGSALFLLDLRTGALTQIPQLPANSGQPAWLSDGRLLFTSVAATGATLWWIDPSAPGTPVQIPTVVQAPAHPSGVR